ncbi:MAG: Hsp20/alpha crystallin family protein [Dehalococcoidia bacterium]
MSSRWDQFDNQFTSLRDAMGRLLDQSFTFGNRGEGAEAAAQNVPVNIFESDDVLMIIAPMPGLEDEDIEITVRGNSLTVEGNERADLKPESGKRYLRHEWRYGPYRRTLELPYAVDANSAEATLGNGVLTVRLQKAVTERSHRIQVKSGAEAESQTIRPTERVHHQTPGQSEQR